jgi:hypothetical protein
MLARARSDFIARRAALTAPTGFLPRLLLCSGLPRASLLTMIDRLGKLGDKAQDKRKTFNQLLVPSAASEWDIGRLGHRREVSRKLLGRLSAYSHMYKVSSLESGEKISTSFLEWLAELCLNVDKPRKAKPKKQKISPASTLSSPRAASSILSALSKEVVVCSQRPLQLDGDASDMTRFVSLDIPEAIVPARSIDGIDAIKNFINQVYEKNQADVLEAWLDDTIVEEAARRVKRTKPIKSAERVDLVDLATHLFQSHLSLKERRERFASLLLKWVPLLSRSRGSPELWQHIFSDESSFQASLSNALLSGCMQIWCESHISSCRTWILAQDSFDALSLDHMVRFLVNTSAQHCVNFEGFAFVAEASKHSEWCNSKGSVATTALLALDCLQQASSDALETALCSRNHPPDCLVLLLLVSSCGRKQVQRVSQAVVQRLEKAEGDARPVLLAVILRLYAAFPHFMNLGVAILRSVLKEAVERYAHEWLEWRSPLDDQFQDMIDTIVSGGAPQRLVQALAEEAKKHPLLVLRKLEFMVQALDADGIVQEHSDNRGIIFGESLNEPHLAKVGGKTMKVTVKHWGFNYTENLWPALLDVVSAGKTYILLHFI